MIDTTRYIRLKAKGLVTLTNTGTGFAVSIKQFDSDTADVQSNIVFGHTMSELVAQKNQLQAELSRLNILINDCQAITQNG